MDEAASWNRDAQFAWQRGPVKDISKEQCFSPCCINSPESLVVTLCETELLSQHATYNSFTSAVSTAPILLERFLNSEESRIQPDGSEHRSFNKSISQVNRLNYEERHQRLKETWKRYLHLNGQGILPTQDYRNLPQQETHLQHMITKDKEGYQQLKELRNNLPSIMDPVLREAKRERDRQRYQRLKEEGNGSIRGFKSPAQQEAYLQRKRAKDRERYHRLKQLGESSPLILNPAQREAKRARDRQRYQRLKEQGLLPSRAFHDPLLQQAYLQRKRERDRERYWRLKAERQNRSVLEFMDLERREAILQRKRERDRARYWRLKMEQGGGSMKKAMPPEQREVRRQRDRDRYQRLKAQRLQESIVIKYEPREEAATS